MVRCRAGRPCGVAAGESGTGAAGRRPSPDTGGVRIPTSQNRPNPNLGHLPGTLNGKLNGNLNGKPNGNPNGKPGVRTLLPRALWAGRRGAAGPMALACALAVTGCGSPAGSGSADADNPTTVVGTITRTSAPVTITRTVDAPGSAAAGSAPTTGSAPAAGSVPANSASAPAAAASAPAAGASAPARSAAAPTTALPEQQTGSCPYLPDDELILMTGQRNGPTKVIRTGLAGPGGEAPICVFYRTDGDWMATVRPFQTPSSAAAVAAVDARIPPTSSSPGDRPAGWAGGYQRLPDGAEEWPDARSVYGVSKGGRALIAWTNRDQTIKARRIVEASIAALKW